MGNRNIRTLHIFSGVGGGISAWIRKAAIYSDEKYTIDAMAFSITDKTNFVNIIESNGGKCYEMPRIRDGIVKLLKYVTTTVKNGDYDLVHCHIDGYGAIPFWLSAKFFCRKPIIIHSHRTAIEKIAGKKHERAIYKVNRVVNHLMTRYKVACGQKAAEFAYGKAKHIQIFHNGIDPVERTCISQYSEEKQINILALGRLNRVKNHEFMLKVMLQLKSLGTQVHLYIVGDGELRNTINAHVQDLKLERYVSLEGYCDTPSSYLNMCDILMMPSFSEGLPTVMLEAQEYGCKVLSSNTVTRECDLELGLVYFMGIDKDNVDEWAQAIINCGKKQIHFTKEELNNALRNNGFINIDIYEDYFKYLKNIVG